MAEIVFADFNNFRTTAEVEELINNRIKELLKQGYSRNEALNIIFESDIFKNKFLSRLVFSTLKDVFYETKN